MKPHTVKVHSSSFTNRRRALFPVDENYSTTENFVSPLVYDSDEPETRPYTIDDFDIIDVVDASDNSTPQNSKVLDSVTSDDSAFESPTTLKHKTPQDVPDNSKAPRLRRALVPVNVDESTCKNPKVRTALFADISPRSFYTNSSSSKNKKYLLKRTMTPRRNSYRRASYPGTKKRVAGQINAGVSHSIKKPKKPKKLSLPDAQRIFEQITENSPLNQLLDETQNKSSDERLLSSIVPDQTGPAPMIKPAVEVPVHSLIKPAVESVGFDFEQDTPMEESNKKFFKTSRSKGGSKRRLLNDASNFFINKPVKRMKMTTFDVFDKNNEPLISNSELSSLIDALDDGNEEKENGSNDTSLSDILMSPTSQMVDMASGLAINTPKKVRNLSPILENIPGPEEPKLFPIFYTDLTKNAECEKKNSPPCPKEKKMKYIKDKSQMLLDAGQKKFGLTQCSECEIVYHIGDPGDEIMHQNYHSSQNVFRYSEWKHERIVFEDNNGKVIKVLPGDPPVWWKKVNLIVDVVNRDLGFYDIRYNLNNAQILLYIKSRKIIGILIAEPRDSGSRLLTKPADPADLCSEQTYPIKCGVSRIWVHKAYRKSGIASILMDSLKVSFIPGEVLENDDIAFSSPTQMGKFFAASYFKTSQFLIYY